MIYTVTLNPSIDYIVEVDDLKLGDLNRMKRDLKLPGGKGINVSRVLNQLGADSTAIGFLGGFTGRFIDDTLREESIKTDFVMIEDDTRINIKLKHGDETEINGLGPAIREQEADALVQKLASLQKNDIVVLSGSIPPSLGGDFYERLIRVCQQTGAEFVIDTTGEALMKALVHKPLLIKPNHHELAELFGVTIHSEEEIVTYGRKLLEAGAKNVLISMAGEGALFITADEVYHANVPAGTVKNSVGAGDSMIAGFVGTLALHGDPIEAFRAGVAAGSATAFSDDLATREKIEQLRPQVTISKR
ncbi:MULTISPECIES: 1-phosphofructokinase [Paenibacillus]|jgi:1-phosphofructokinase|uniref:1-phosphofructokinase n=1 Tax=Paenibacillus TaxID=44249 RepID=UPI000D31D3B1|nr:MULTISPECIES: 1-phosphofructokinase [Paenibacillus]MDP9676681.1 1-phosphofructokinase [Paenibacillus jamilae]KAF6619116.1 1-phosphofructokinase [Paenibacillus sp. EKM101P]KAF6624207.1 1-phosphofructokinase [Paenibacillus sp. EKM102P]KAF6636018.1 1-phosphofructokinase [Paenibacillus sp. EKM10P]KAF6648278.1 1-phosphofructokinase [Paenibacillus sp. EKM11P]